VSRGVVDRAPASSEPPARADERRWTRAATRMGAVTAVSRVFGFVRVLVIAAVLGTTFLGNAFQAANSVSNVVFELVAAGALSAVLVPTFVQLLEKGDDAEANRLTSGLLGLALVGLGAITLVAMAFAPLIAHLLTIGVADDAVAAQQRALETYLLRWFLPQIVLYAWAAIATAVLYARRHFAITAAAPIANTVVMVGALVVFRIVAGPDPTLQLSSTERLLLAIAGTGGVVGFVGVLVVAARRAGFSLRPRWVGRDPALGRLLRLSGWGALLNTNAGLLLGAAIVVGGSVAGGVVAYQVAFVFFLAPYAILSQPISTAILPELSLEAEHGAGPGFTACVRAALDRMAVLVVPVSAALVALALPIMRAVVFGRAAGDGAELLAAGLAGLSIGLYPYGAFLLFARAYYALDDSRTPALAAIASALVGVATMIVGGALTHGAARVAVLGIGHSVAYTLGALLLGAGVARRTRGGVVPRHLGVVVALSIALAGLAWLAMRALDPETRIATIASLAVVGGAGLVAYAAVARRWLHVGPRAGAAA
jgi:putative peptidoglycan lipid II flippase